MRWILEGFLKKPSLELGIGSGLSFELMEIRRQRAFEGICSNNAVVRLACQAWPEHRGHLLGNHLLWKPWDQGQSLDVFQWAREHPCRRRNRMKLPPSHALCSLFILPSQDTCWGLCPQIATWFLFSPFLSFHSNITSEWGLLWPLTKNCNQP